MTVKLHKFKCADVAIGELPEGDDRKENKLLITLYQRHQQSLKYL